MLEYKSTQAMLTKFSSKVFDCSIGVHIVCHLTFSRVAFKCNAVLKSSEISFIDKGNHDADGGPDGINMLTSGGPSEYLTGIIRVNMIDL